MRRKTLLLMLLMALFSSGAWAQTQMVYTSYSYDNGTSHYASDQSPAKLVDNIKNADSKWCVPHFTDHSPIWVEFHSAQPIIPVGYVMTTGGDCSSYTGRNPRSWVIKAKRNSGDDWTTIETQSNNTRLEDVNLQDYTFNINNSTEYQYFHFEVSSIAYTGPGYNVFQLTELQFLVGGGSPNDLTVADATGTNSEIPVCGTWVDAFQHTQTIYPSSMLTDMQGGQITKLTYYLSSSASDSWGNARFKVTLGTTTTNEFPSGTTNYLTLSNPVVVYTNGALDATGSTMVINFTTPYTYSSGNLVVDIQETTTGTFKSATFYGESARIRYSLKKHDSSSVPTQGDATTFMPKTTFTYSVPHPNQIATVDDWNAFCRAVNSGYSYSGETVTMTANVGTVNTICGKLTGVDDTTPKAFSGTFDGGGHTLTVNYTDQPRFAAPFKFLDGATIRNLRTSGSITGSSTNDGKVIAGLVGVSKGTTNIIGCSSNVNITSYFNSGNDVALSGLVAAINGGTLTVEGCAFEGSLTASTSNNNHNGGIVGYWYSGTHVYVRNTIFAPSALNVTTGDTGYSWTIARLSNNANVTIENCYYTRVLGNEQGKQRYTITGQSPVDVSLRGTKTDYGASGIKAYKDGSTQLPGLLYNGTIIAGSSDNVNLTLGGGDDYQVNYGSLSGSGSSYTLAMTANNTVISAIQIQPATLPYTENFENGQNGWQFVNGNGWQFVNGTRTNKWYCGAAGAHDGSNGLFISNNGTANEYTISSSGAVWAYKVINFDETKDYIFSFDWRANGESYGEGCCDYLRAGLVPASTTLVDGTDFNTPTGWIDLNEGNIMNVQSSWQTKTATINVTAGTYKLAFCWRNDDIWGTNPPAAIDNIDVHVAPTHTITVTANPSAGGTVSGGGTIAESNTCTLVATPNPGYNFVNWTENGTEVSTDASYTFIVESDRNLVANFEAWTVSIASYSNSQAEKGGYYLIASPLADDVDPATVTGMITDNLGNTATTSTSTYDLYSFDQAAALEWQNYRASNFNLVNGTGYLYASKGGTTLTFSGAPYSGDTKTVTLHKAEAATGLDFPAWNLVGNPFAVDDAYITKSFYTLENSDTYTINTAVTAIHPMQGLFVVAESDNEDLIFSKTSNREVASLHMNVSKVATRGVSAGTTNVVDQAIISFTEGQELPKLQFRNGSTKVYLPKDCKEYAIVSAESMGTMPVNFKAENNGRYTLSVDIEKVSFNYLHLIDNMTGNDVDLLATPSYSFDAKTTDYESRFKLVFATGNASDDNFAFFSNGSFVINNEGNSTLQVIDVNGRILKSESINGCANLNVNAASGVYMIRLVNGENVKVQKVVVR